MAQRDKGHNYYQRILRKATASRRDEDEAAISKEKEAEGCVRTEAYTTQYARRANRSSA
jgi:hypothetical protein